jgi:hypothetical protein
MLTLGVAGTGDCLDTSTIPGDRSGKHRDLYPVPSRGCKVRRFRNRDSAVSRMTQENRLTFSKLSFR